MINQLLSPWVQATTTKYKQQLRNIQWKILKGHEWYACSLNKKWHIVVNLGQFENGAAPQTACKVHVFGVSKQQKRSSKWASHADTVHDKCLKKVLILVIVPNTFLWCIVWSKKPRKVLQVLRADKWLWLASNVDFAFIQGHSYFTLS